MNTEEQAVEFLRNIAPAAKTLIIYHGDADGACSGAIVFKGLKAINKTNCLAKPLGRGENPFSDSIVILLREIQPQNLIVVDSGSRSGHFSAGISTLIIDHHVPDGNPDVTVLFNTYLDGTLRTASGAALDAVKKLIPDIQAIEWLGLAGTIGDLGPDIPEAMMNTMAKYGAKTIQELISLINAARRHPSYRVEMVFELLTTAESPAEFLRLAGDTPLPQLKRDVNAELKRCLKIAPRIAGTFALIELNTPFQVHPLIAKIWAGKLSKSIVMAANRGYLPQRVSFSVRTNLDIDLVEMLKKYRSDGEEIGYGHKKATGGIVSEKSFRKLTAELGLKSPLISANQRA